MNDYMKANLDWWNDAAITHAQGDAYELTAFKSGKSKLKSLELAEVGDVAGKSLLHLQCHFGLDTLSWAILGARVTGVDFSDQAIQLARAISKDVGIDANFICANIYDLPGVFPLLPNLISSSLPMVP
jgi:2-polyprenyl-3-methyl-5-hydroxy-6-metoxy-1,4-benzoquinol methylase